MPWRHEAHKINLIVDRTFHQDAILVKRDDQDVDISVLEAEGFEMMAVVSGQFHNVTVGIFKRFVDESVDL